MRQKYRRVLTLFAALAVVSTSFIGVIGTAPVAAQETTDSSENDSETEYSPSSGECIDKVTGKPGVCDMDRWASITGQTATEIHLGMVNNADAMHDRMDRATVESSSTSNLTTSMAIEEGAVEFIKCYNNGTSVSQCKGDAVLRVSTFQSELEASLMYKQTAMAEQMRTWSAKINGTGDLSEGDVFPNVMGSQEFEFVDRQYELLNGSKINVTQVVVYDTYYHNNEPQTDHFITWYDGEYRGDGEFNSMSFDSHEGILPLNVRGPPNTGGETVIAFDGERFNQTRFELHENYEVAVSNVRAFGDMWSKNYERGEVSAAEYASPGFRMRQHSTDFSDTGHYSYVVFAAQDRGMAVDIDTAYTVEYTQVDPETGNLSNTTVGPVNGSFAPGRGMFEGEEIQSGATYDMRERNGTAWFINKDAEQTTLNGTITILEMRDVSQEGNPVINSTTVQSTGFDTTSSDAFKQDVREWMNQWEDQQQAQEDYNVSTNVTIGFPSVGDLFGGSGIGMPSPAMLVGGFVILIGLTVAISSLVDALKPL